MRGSQVCTYKFESRNKYRVKAKTISKYSNIKRKETILNKKQQG